MSLQTRLESLVAAVGADIKSLQSQITALGGGGGPANASYREIPLLLQQGAIAWTSMPSALTEWNGATRTRMKLDLTGVTQARLTAAVTTAGATAAEVRVQYATDGNTQAAWAYLDGTSGPLVGIGSTSPAGKVGNWVNLVAGAKADVWVRAVGISGNGSTSPVVSPIVLQLK